MGLRTWWRRARAPKSAAPRRQIDIRVARSLFEEVRAHVEDFTRGEEAGYLVCSISNLADRNVLLARRWVPVPESAIDRNRDGSVLSWSSSFNSDVLSAAIDEDSVPVLVHSHGSAAPEFSPDDRHKERELFSTFSRLLGVPPTGSLLLGRRDAAGSFWTEGTNTVEFGRLIIAGAPLEVWPSTKVQPPSPPVRRRLARQSLAIGPDSDTRLALAKVGVIGISGGGSHVVQQLSHQGIGTLIPIDDQLVDLTNLGRVVGATLLDVETTSKVELARRIAGNIDPSINVTGVEQRFPTAKTIAALKEADVIIACLDRFDAREAVNAFCRRHMIPLVDIGMTIRSEGERLGLADGQVIVTLPGDPCMRCWFLTDALLAAERRDRPPGYDQNPNAPGDPQVVSMNGVLASEACNSVLDLITGYSGGRRGSGIWRYEGRSGTLEPSELPSARPGCPACAEQGRGDPVH